jgi:hypothetical protein
MATDWAAFSQGVQEAAAARRREELDLKKQIAERLERDARMEFARLREGREKSEFETRVADRQRGIDAETRKASEFQAFLADPAIPEPMKRMARANRAGFGFNTDIHAWEDPAYHTAHLTAGKARESDEKFAAFQREHDYRVAHPIPSGARILTRTQDDPALPRGVKDWIARLSTERPSYDDAKRIFVSTLPRLRTDHPNLDAIRALRELRGAFGQPPGGDDELSRLLNGSGGAPSGARLRLGAPAPSTSPSSAPAGAESGDDYVVFRERARPILEQHLKRQPTEDEIRRFLSVQRNRDLLRARGQ